MATGLEKAFLGLAAAGGVYYFFLRKEDTAHAMGADLTSAECEDLLSKVPEPFRSVLLSKETDLSNPATIEYLATEMEKVGLKKQAACLRHFKNDIVKEMGGTPTNCEDLIGKITFLSDAQKGFIRATIANPAASREDLMKISDSLRTAGNVIKASGDDTTSKQAFELADCIKVIAAEKKETGLTPGFLDTLKKVFASAVPPLELAADPSKLGGV